MGLFSSDKKKAKRKTATDYQIAIDKLQNADKRKEGRQKLREATAKAKATGAKADKIAVLKIKKALAELGS
jgi:hypothetical protein